MSLLSLNTKGRSLSGRFFSCWSKADCNTQAAAISYFAALSIFPFVVVLITGTGFFFDAFEGGNNAEKEVFATMSEIFSPEMSASVAKLMESFQSQANVGGPIAALVLLYLSSKVFVQIDRALQAIFRLETTQKHSLRRSALQIAARSLRSIGVVFAYGVVVILVFYGGTALYAVESFVKTWLPETELAWGLRSKFLSLTVTTLLFGSIYRLLSRRAIHWKISYGVGLLVAVLWVVGRSIVANLVIGEKYTALGVTGSFLAILVWIYCNSIVLLFGAVLVRVIADEASEAETANAP